MKKLTLFLTLILGIFTASADDLIVSQGATKPLRSGGPVTATISLDNAKWNSGDQLLASQVPSISALAQKAKIAFNREFDYDCKRSAVAKKGETPKFNIAIEIVDVLGGYTDKGKHEPGYEVRLLGTITITDAKTGDIICVADLAEIEGDRFPSVEGSCVSAFKELGEETASLFNKAK